MTVAPAVTVAPLESLLESMNAGYWGGNPNDSETIARVIRNGDVLGDGELRWEQLPLRGLRESEVEKAQVEKDDLVITTSGECGYVAHVRYHPAEVTCATNFVRVVRVAKDKVLPRYLFHFMNRAAFRASLAPFIRGTTMKNLSVFDAFTRLTVPLPSLAEQHRIANLLDRANDLRVKRIRALECLDELPQAIFTQCFGDPRSNLRGWPLQKLSSLGRLDRGVSRHRPRNAPELLGGPYPLVQTGDVANSDGYIRRYRSTYSELGLRQSKLWDAGTLCITIAANIAKTGILAFDACFPDSVVGFVAPGRATVEYVRVWLSFLQKALEESAPESAQKNINLAILRELDVPVPPEELRSEFVERLQAVTKLKEHNRRSLDSLEELFAGMQQRAFAGVL